MSEDHSARFNICNFQRDKSTRLTASSSTMRPGWVTDAQLANTAALRRALGQPRHVVLVQVLAETVICGAAGGFLGALAGQLAVAHVVINRAKSGRFPKSLCGVVHQPSQFSFVRGGRMPAVRNGAQWNNAVAIAQIARDGSWKNQAPGALFFHARYVSPGWRKTRVAAIDNHIFYR